MSNHPKARIQKLISQSGVASRRKAEELVREGKVYINDRKAQIGDSASFDDKIVVNGKLITKKPFVYFLLNKPQNYLSTVTDDHNRKTVVDLIKTDEYIYPVGRLDIDTIGVLLLTNDGELTNLLLHPSNEVKRIYHAHLFSQLTNEQLCFLNSNKVLIDNKKSKQIVKHVKENTYSVVLYEGWHHHVKKIFRAVGQKIKLLERKEFANLKVDNLKIGSYRPLSNDEVAKLYKLPNKTT